ncbi:MAG: FAD-dependent oxidoreductase [Clostridiales bacterium]|nr:FAD-dependent oxidoreductase [Clostridiales bacterium]
MVIKTTAAPLWTSLSSAPAQYPWLDQDLICDVAVVGGGLAAAMCAYRFAEAGHTVALMSASSVGSGGTSCSSGIMSVDGEDSLSELAGSIGADRAMMAAELLREAMDHVEALCAASGSDCGFRRTDSLRYTEEESGIEKLRREYTFRLHNGISSELLDRQSGAEWFSFPMAAGVYSKRAAAVADPYRLVHAVVSLAAAKGAKIFENTAVCSLYDSDGESPEAGEGNDGLLTLETSTRRRVKAGYVILATGSGSARIAGTARTEREYEEIRTTYMVATEPVEEFSGWQGPCVIRREGGERLYLTVTPDSRLLIGGLDSLLVDEKGRVAGLLNLGERHSDRRYEELERRLREMFPAIREITPEFVYAARDARTKDGLPVIGHMPDDSGLPAPDRVAYALCGGDNGILYAEIAGRLLLEQFEGRNNRELGLFSPGRAWRVKH